jgi:hypothetical protein
MIRRAPPGGLSATDLAARVLVVAAGLSLNDLFTRAIGVGQVASPAMFVASVILLLRVNGRTMALPSLLLLGVLASYVIIGLLFSVLQGNVGGSIRYLYMYLASGALALAIISYIVNVENDATLYNFLRFARTVFTISSVLILVSPILDQVLPYSIYAIDGRFRGVFANPNEASYLGVFAWVLCTAIPYKNRRLQAVAVLAIVAGVISTLSKGGIIVLVALMAYKAFDIKRPTRTAAFMFLAAMSVLLVQMLQYVVSQILLLYSSALSASQVIRILQVTGLLSGQIDSTTTTGRTLMWQLSLERFASDFPMGGGLGSFHFLAGGIRENGIWQGSHNLYLMILGEAGPIPVLLLLLMGVVSVAGALSLKGKFREFLLLMWIALAANGVQSHNTLELRYVLVILAIALGLTIRLNPKYLPQTRARRARSWAAHPGVARGLPASGPWPAPDDPPRPHIDSLRPAGPAEPRPDPGLPLRN